MSEVEVQESQKTIVAFITGLLIGGLLVWVFSSTPESKKDEMTKDDTKTEVTVPPNENSEVSSGIDAETESESTSKNEITGTGSITVLDQSAGDSVAISNLSFPQTSGWVVVRDYMDGNPGNVLGAARYDAELGLVPTTVSLMRSTIADNHYEVIFYSNEGDQGFSLKEDTLVEGTGKTFKAN